jgi:cold shock CspA family protein
MRYQGKITHWKDDKGFGFITPNGGGQQVFVHIKSFANRQRRPSIESSVIYEMKTDAKGRPQAENVVYVGDRTTVPAPAGQGTASLIFTAVFLVLVAAVVFAGKLPHQALGTR